jgi:hypothetical protein
MRRAVLFVGLVVLVFAVSAWAQAQAQAPTPDLALNKFDFMVGHWTYEREYKAGPLGPAYKAAGEMTCKRILGGFFFQNQLTEKGPAGVSHSIEIIGYDPVNKNYFSNEYDDQGGTLSGPYIFSGNTLAYTGKIAAGGKSILVKGTMTIATDLTGLTEKCEISTDGNTWATWIEGRFTKVKPAPKAK